MIIIKLKGGLGNQMFQYAFGRSLSLHRNEQLFLDISNFGNESKNDTPREYALYCFNIRAEIASPEIIKKFNSPLNKFIRKVKSYIERNFLKKGDYSYNGIVNSKVTALNSNTKSEYFEGFWQNEKYFLDYSDQIRADFSLTQKSLDDMSPRIKQIETELKNSANQNQNTKTISLHIRRGDYVSNPITSANHTNLELDYYYKALAQITSKIGEGNIKIYIFSDDIDWVKIHLKLSNYSVEYVSNSGEKNNTKPHEELYLMSLCQHHIIANSSFSWWGAWLNPNPQKIVVAPKQWLKNNSIDTSDVCPPSWIRI
jgi:hypothetical protein